MTLQSETTYGVHTTKLRATFTVEHVVPFQSLFHHNTRLVEKKSRLNGCLYFAFQI